MINVSLSLTYNRLLWLSCRVIVMLWLVGLSQLAYAQTINWKDTGCSGSGTADVLTQTGTVGCRNTFEGASGNGNIPFRVIWSTSNNRWEMQADPNWSGTGSKAYTVLAWYNTFASSPNPPALGTGSWVDAGVPCGPMIKFDGTGTQTTLGSSCGGSPAITAGTATGTITACQGTASVNTQSFTVAGSDLTASLIANAPVNFEISTNASAGFGSSLSFPQTSGTVSVTTVYVRASASAPATSISGSVTLSSSGASPQTVGVTGTVSTCILPVTLTTRANPTTVCIGGTASLSVTASGGVTPFSYTWTAPAGALITAGGSSSVASVSTTTTGVKTFTVTVAGSGGSPASTTTVSLTVNGNPTAVITATPSLTFCLGSTISLSASGAGSGGTYRWSTTENTAAISVSLGQPYTVTAVTAGGCWSTTSVTAVRRSLPDATVSAVPGLTVCPGQSVMLTANGTAGAPGARVASLAAPPPVLYTWSTGSNTGSTSFVPTSSTVISLTVNDGVCSSSAISTSVTVRSVTSVSITASGSPTLTCNQTSLTLTAVASGSSTFTWNDNSTNATRVVSTSGVYSVTALEGGCSTTAAVTVSSNTAVPALSISGNLSICVGGSTTLTASGTGGNAYQWSNGTNNAVNVVSPVSTTAYSVTLSNTATGCFTTTTVTVSVSPAVTATIGGNLTICSGRSTTLTTGAGTSYLWSDGFTGRANIVSPVSTTAYSVTVSNGVCSATATATVTVNTSPTVTVSASSTALTGGQSAVLTASGAASYLWGAPLNTTAASVTVSPATTTVYSVTGTQNGCVGEGSITVSVSCADPVSKAISVTMTSVLGPGNCSVNLQGQGTGSAFVFSGPNGYVFSTVYRRTGTYSLNATGVRQPGTYTLTAKATNACGQESMDTITYVVTGTACP
ncbi:beta strand repeat-containing protein [Arsenicibacter rosenii]|uniref:Ig-like domain-containing protein n=1 Tax=Arsenicibacter rosenii TaxID=1750698 RepID=A0A1S2VHL3_9BACT|nr:hypothetical protein [Arsenicibacter rosenii]OIN58241.1 hypothetical protein BLX24_14630 [Arsenicibacter rosenii]